MQGRASGNLNFGVIVLIVDDLVVRRHAEQGWVRFRALDIPQTHDDSMIRPCAHRKSWSDGILVFARP